MCWLGNESLEVPQGQEGRGGGRGGFASCDVGEPTGRHMTCGQLEVIPARPRLGGSRLSPVQDNALKGKLQLVLQADAIAISPLILPIFPFP